MFWSLMEKEQGGYCNLFWDKDSKEKEKGIITESPIKNLWSNFIMEKNEKKNCLLIFPNIFIEQWGSRMLFKEKKSKYLKYYFWEGSVW